MIAWLREEPRRLWRGLRALQHVLGPRFTAGLLLTFGLLLWGVLHVHGALVFVLALVCVLLAIRAHDLGDVEEPEPSEYGSNWQGWGESWSDYHDRLERERKDAARAQVEFLSRRNSVVGKPHDPAEL